MSQASSRSFPILKGKPKGSQGYSYNQQNNNTNHETKGLLSKDKISINSVSVSQSNSFAQKLDKWKRRMSSSQSKMFNRSPYVTRSRSRAAASSTQQKKTSSSSKDQSQMASTTTRYPYNKDQRTQSTEDDLSAIENTEVIYNDVIQGMSKMSSSSRDEDHTTVTAASTQDDGSTFSEYTNASALSVHTFKAGNQSFTLDKRYQMLRTIGSGAYGVVISAKDHVNNNSVAVKMVPKAFQDEIDAKRILREIKLLKHFRHENIIGIVDMMPPLCKKVEDYSDVYIITDLMETDLHRIIYSKQSLSIDHVQYFLYQILRALKYMHSANVLHRDLKPSNLLVNSNCDLKVCDFGLARGVTDCDDGSMESAEGGSVLFLTEYVVTRWYRAPEIMLACHEYSKPIDIWSVGCIFAELLQRKPYFPGDDYIDQLSIISEKLGKLPEQDLDFVTSEKAKRFMRKLSNKLPVPLKRQFPKAPSNALDLLSKMLQIHPKRRITVEQALAHPFLASLHSPEDEPVAHANFDFSFEDEKLHRARLQELIWEEVGDFRPYCLPVPVSFGKSKKQSFCQKLYHA